MDFNIENDRSTDADVGCVNDLTYYGNIWTALGMCLEENYSNSPSNEYSRHYSAESEYLRHQDMNSKSGEEQKKGHHVRRSPNFDSNSDKWQKKGQNDNTLKYYALKY